MQEEWKGTGSYEAMSFRTMKNVIVNRKYHAFITDLYAEKEKLIFKTAIIKLFFF